MSILHYSSEFVAKHKHHHHFFLAVLALVVAGTGAYTYRHEIVQAATFTFTQSSTGLGGGGWTGLDTATPLATHTSNQSNWSKYSALSTYINADANGISLPSTAKPIMDDGVALSAKTDYTSGAGPDKIAVSSDGTSVYVVNISANTVSMFPRNTSTGALSAKTDYTTGTSPTGVAISPDGTSVYVTNLSSNTVSMFPRNTSTGVLSAKTDYTAGAGPYKVVVSPDGISVYVANNSTNTVSMFPRNTSTGALSAKTDYTTGTGPGDVTISPDGTSVYVTNGTANTISKLPRNTSTGVLSAKTDYTTASGPGGVVISPDGTSVYVVNNGPATVSMFPRNTSTGALSARTDYTTATGPIGIAIPPGGSSVYVVNYFGPSISMFPRNTSTGVLSAKTDYTAGAGAEFVALSPDGTSVYVTNNGVNTVSMYSRANGPGFENGASSNTTITGSGTSASVGLLATSIDSGTGADGAYSCTGGTCGLGDTAWNSVAHNGTNLFVAVGGSGQGKGVMTSPDGITWTRRTGIPDNNWTSVAYGAGLFVAVANSGTGNRVMTSPDGITWTSRTSAADNSWNAVAYGTVSAVPGFVAVASTGTSNRVMTSPDGITWTTRTTGTARSWGSVAYNSATGVWIAADAGSSGYFMTSPDGITWTIVLHSPTPWGRQFYVTNGAGVWVEVAYNDNLLLYSSTDGSSWTQGGGASVNNWKSVTYGGGLFVAVAGSGSGNGSRVMTSSNASAWTTRASSADNDWTSVTYGGGLFVAVARTGAGNRVMTSPDGITWTSRSTPVDTYNFTTFNISAGSTVLAGDSSAVNIKATGNVTIAGTLSANGGAGNTSISGAVAVAGGSCGGGGSGVPACGAGGGIQPTYPGTGVCPGGGGGTYGALGGNGGGATNGSGSYSSVDSESMGGGSSQYSSPTCTATNAGGGGASGGNIKIQSAGTISVSGAINADGGAGGSFRGGGGSGGRVYLLAGTVTNTGTITARGGVGGTGGTGFGGGGGGGGRIYLYGTTVTAGTNTLTGGAGGTGTAGAGSAGSTSAVVSSTPPYLTPGTFTSSVIDTGAKSNFTTLAFTNTLPANTAITIDIRAGDSATAPAWGSTDSNWTSTGLTGVTNGGSISGLGAHRYIQYRANLSTSNLVVTPTLDSVTINSTQYALSGNLTSSAYDTIDSTNILAGISWTVSGTSASETVAFQIRSSADNVTWTNWCGSALCNGIDTFTTSPATIGSSHPIRTDGIADKFIQYKVFLTSGGAVTPIVSQAVMTYVVNAPPAVANVSATQVSDSASANYGKVSFSFDASDPDTTTGSPANQLKLTPTLYEYSTNGGGAWNTISSGLSANAYSVIALTGDSATTTTAVIWTPASGIALTANAKIRVTVTDAEAANATASGSSGAFTLDTAIPVVSVASINSSGTQDVVDVTATDGSTISYRLSNSAFASATSTEATWSTITSGVATSTSWSATGAPNAETVYLQVRDLYGNLTSSTIVAPATPASFLAADVSNPPASSFGETLSWLTVANATSYNVYYATTTSSASPMPTTYILLASPATNVYAHTITTATTSAYWYKVRAVNSNGDISNYATIATGDVPDSFGTSLSDATAPDIRNLQVVSADTKSTSAHITFNTFFDNNPSAVLDLATSTIEYSTQSANNFASSTVSTLYVSTHSVYLTGLEPNTTYVYRVKVADVLGNVTTSAVAGTPFTTASGPVITNVTEREITNNSALIFWNTSTSSTSYVKYSTTQGGVSTGTQAGNATMVPVSDTAGIYQHQVGLTGLTTAQTYYFQVTSTDSAGNPTTDTNNGQYYSFVTLRDTSPPIISATSTPVLAPDSAVVVWQTDEPASTKVEYGITNSYGTIGEDASAPLSIYHVRALTTLTKETLYYYRVTSKDAATNTATADGTFTTPADGNVVISVSVRAGDTKDTTPPSISNVTVSDITPFSAVVKFSTDEDAVAGVDAGATQAYGQTASSFDWGKTQTIKLRGLTLGTEYHIRVKAVDKAGNTGTSADQTFKTTFLSENLKDMANVENIEQFQKEIENAIESILPSLVPPFVTKPIVSDITESGAKVAFKSNIKAFPVVVFAEDGAYDETKENPYTGEVSDTAEKATSHELLLTGLKGNTKYHIQARAFSLPKVLGKSVDVTFITKASKIAGSIVERKKDSFTVVWTTDQPTTTIVEYKDLKRGVTERKVDDAKKTSHSMKIENLPSGTAYEVNLSGLTEQGNIAEAGSPLSVTTSTDVTPPAISGFKVDNALVPGRTDRIQTIVSWVTDEPGNSTVYYEEGAGTPGDTKELANKNESLDSFITAHSVILPNLKPGTIYRLKVTSSDDSGNEGSFGPRTVITPKQTESITDIIFKNFEDSFKFMRKI